jgi:CheY-like chemotaxis protein
LISKPGRSILILEDDDQSRDVARCILQGGGFDVICAHDFFEAIHHVECDTKIDVALIDVNMRSGTPNGVSFARMALLRRPSLKVIFTSGNTTAHDYVRFDKGEAFLCKPFAPHHLLEVVARAAA